MVKDTSDYAGKQFHAGAEWVNSLVILRFDFCFFLELDIVMLFFHSVGKMNAAIILLNSSVFFFASSCLRYFKSSFGIPPNPGDLQRLFFVHHKYHVTYRR